MFQTKAAESGSGRLQGSYLQDFFSAPPYGWTKDTVRYLFAALLRAGEIEFHVPGAGGPVRTAGPQAVEAVKSTVSFNRIGISPRDAKLPPEALDRAARRLEMLFGDEVLPLEDHISRSVRRHVPDLLEKLGSLPDRLRLLESSWSKPIAATPGGCGRPAERRRRRRGGRPRRRRMRTAGRNHLGQGGVRSAGDRSGGGRPERQVDSGFDGRFGTALSRFHNRSTEPGGQSHCG